MKNTLDIEKLKEKANCNDKQPNGNLRDTIIRARRILLILKRDKFACVKCKSKEELTIDHINGRKFAKWNNSRKYELDKCQTLCSKCHDEKNESNR